jgi:hypothetical protein
LLYHDSVLKMESSHHHDGVIPTGAVLQAKGGLSPATGPASPARDVQ